MFQPFGSGHFQSKSAFSASAFDYESSYSAQYALPDIFSHPVLTRCQVRDANEDNAESKLRQSKERLRAFTLCCLSCCVSDAHVLFCTEDGPFDSSNFGNFDTYATTTDSFISNIIPFGLPAVDLRLRAETTVDDVVAVLQKAEGLAHGLRRGHVKSGHAETTGRRKGQYSALNATHHRSVSQNLSGNALGAQHSRTISYQSGATDETPEEVSVEARPQGSGMQSRVPSEHLTLPPPFTGALPKRHIDDEEEMMFRSSETGSGNTPSHLIENTFIFGSDPPRTENKQTKQRRTTSFTIPSGEGISRSRDQHPSVSAPIAFVLLFDLQHASDALKPALHDLLVSKQISLGGSGVCSFPSLRFLCFTDRSQVGYLNPSLRQQFAMSMSFPLSNLGQVLDCSDGEDPRTASRPVLSSDTNEQYQRMVNVAMFTRLTNSASKERGPRDVPGSPLAAEQIFRGHNGSVVFPEVPEANGALRRLQALGAVLCHASVDRFLRMHLAVLRLLLSPMSASLGAVLPHRHVMFTDLLCCACLLFNPSPRCRNLDSDQSRILQGSQPVCEIHKQKPSAFSPRDALGQERSYDSFERTSANISPNLGPIGSPSGPRSTLVAPSRSVTRILVTTDDAFVLLPYFVAHFVAMSVNEIEAVSLQSSVSPSLFLSNTAAKAGSSMTADLGPNRSEAAFAAVPTLTESQMIGGGGRLVPKFAFGGLWDAMAVRQDLRSETDAQERMVEVMTSHWSPSMAQGKSFASFRRISQPYNNTTVAPAATRRERSGGRGDSASAPRERGRDSALFSPVAQSRFSDPAAPSIGSGTFTASEGRYASYVDCWALVCSALVQSQEIVPPA